MKEKEEKEQFGLILMIAVSPLKERMSMCINI
jgi:hypothetical protein